MSTSSAASFFRSRWVAGARRASRSSIRPSWRPGFRRRRASACGLKGGGRHRRRAAGLRPRTCDSALLLTRNAAAAAPVRVCRDRLRSRARSGRWSSTPETPTPPPASRAIATRSRCGTRPPRRSGSSPRSVAVAETGTIGVPLRDRRGAAPGSPRRRGACPQRGGEAFARAIMTTDRGPKRCTVRGDGVTVSAQAKGAGMIEPALRDDALLRPDRRSARPTRTRRFARRSTASFERITVDGQMSTNDTVAAPGDGRVRPAAARGPARGGPAAARARGRRRRRGRHPGRAGSRSPGRPPARRPSGWRGRSPTRRWSRRPSTAATPTGAGSPRPPGMALAGQRARASSGPTAIEAGELGSDAARGRDRAAARARRRRGAGLLLGPQRRLRAS